MGTPAQSRMRIGPADIDIVALEHAAELIARGEATGGIHLCNAYTLALADENSALADVLGSDTANLPDGMPLVWWARRSGHPHAERVYGPDLMERVLDIGRELGTRHYLYGSTPDVLAALETAIESRWPGALVVGVESPPFRELSDDELRMSIANISASRADVVWVGMGTPKQDFLVHRMSAMSGHTFVAIGAAFDFIAGTKRQAPRWMMRIGLEWLYRLLSEPRRLWNRYLVYNWRFVRLLARSRSA